MVPEIWRLFRPPDGKLRNEIITGETKSGKHIVFYAPLEDIEMLFNGREELFAIATYQGGQLQLHMQVGKEAWE